MTQDLQKLRNDVWTWRLIAVIVWQIGCLALASLFCKSFSRSFLGLLGAFGSSLSSATCLEVLQITALFSYILILATYPPEPSVRTGQQPKVAGRIATPPLGTTKSAWRYLGVRLTSGFGSLLSSSLTVAAENWLRSAAQPVGQNLHAFVSIMVQSH